MDMLGLINEEFAGNVVHYLVNRGYDDEDYLKVLGLAKGASLICRLLRQ